MNDTVNTFVMFKCMREGVMGQMLRLKKRLAS